MSNIKNNAATQETCRKLMNAAGAIFALKGVHATTIKEITDLAGVNMAAVNYHFKDKFELYETVVQESYQSTIACWKNYPVRTGTAEERLKQYVETLLNQLLVPDRPEWEPALICREITTPCSKVFELIQTDLRNQSLELLGILDELTDKQLTDEKRAVVFCSIVGQCLFHLQQKTFIKHIFPKIHKLDDIPTLADHISQLAINGLRQF